MENLGELIGEKLILLELVLMKIHGDAHQWTIEAVAVRRIEIKIYIPIAVHAAMHSGPGLDRAQVIVPHRLLPLRTPLGCARWHRSRLDRPPAGLHLSHVAAADEAMWSMIEVIAVELIDAHADGARSDEGIENELRLVEEAFDVGDCLMREIASDHALVRHRIVRRSDLRE